MKQSTTQLPSQTPKSGIMEYVSLFASEIPVAYIDKTVLVTKSSSRNEAVTTRKTTSRNIFNNNLLIQSITLRVLSLKLRKIMHDILDWKHEQQ